MTHAQDRSFLATEPVGKLLLKLAVPTVAAQVINMLYNIVDRIFIGHMPGDGALALTGVGVCMPLIMLVSAFAALVASGGAPRASIAMGEGRREHAERIMGNCLTLLLSISVILTFILLLFGEDLLLAFGASENTIGYAAAYMNIYAIGTVFVQLTLGMNMFITTQGFAATSMISVLIGAVSNIILDPIFIYGLRLGVRGAALATILSQSISCIWVMSFLCGKKTALRIRRENLRPDSRVFLPCIALGLATFIMQMSESVISVCFNSSLLKYGGDTAVGAMTILTSIMQFCSMPLQGLGQGAQPIISYNFGAKNAARVREAYFCLLRCCLCFSIPVWALIQLFPGFFASIFTADAALIAFAAPALRIYTLILGLFGIQIACQMTFTSIGSAGSAILVAVMRKFILLVPLIYIMPAIFTADKTMAVYMAEPVADFLSVCFAGTLFFFQFRKALHKMKHP